jgi:hypothetical protein
MKMKLLKHYSVPLSLCGCALKFPAQFVYLRNMI